MFDDYLFVYGTLRRETASSMAVFLAKQSRFVNYARYCGKLYAVADYPAVVASTNSLDRVYGEVYALTTDFVLPVLDDYEECSAAFAEPHEYVRQKQPVLLADGQTVSAWLYLYQRGVVGLPLIESGDFLARKKSVADEATLFLF